MSKNTQEDLAKRLIDEIRNAYTENNIKHIKTLISTITNLDRVIDGDTALTLASEKGLFSVVTFLVEAGASLDVKVKNGDSALIIASKYRYKEDFKKIVKYLVKHGANIDVQDNNGKTALMYAIRSDGRTDVLAYLLKHGANVNLRDNNGKSALMYATSVSNSAAVKLLLEKGANPDFQDTGNFGNSALIEASGRGDLDSVDLLLKHGANADLQSNISGSTALITASHGIVPSHLTIVKHLLKHGANKDIRDRMFRRTARDTAVAFGQPAIVDLIDNYVVRANAASKLKNVHGVMTLRKKFNEKGAVPVPEDVETIISTFLSGHEGTLKQQRNSLARTLGRKSPPQYGPRRHPLMLTHAEAAEDAEEGPKKRAAFSAALNSHATKTYYTSGGRRTKRRALRPNKTRRRR